MIYAILLIAVIVFIIIILGQQNKSNGRPREKDIGFEVNMSSDSNDRKEDTGKWELVRRKSDRWNELGFGEGENFPGYGKLYDREFDVWYCDVGSKEKKGFQKFYDRNPLHYEPKNRRRDNKINPDLKITEKTMSSDITGEEVYFERLRNTKEYEALYSGLDEKNRKRWYFALINYKPTGIETDRAIETAEEIENIKEEPKVPEGWTFVERKSDEWFANGFGEDESFPGYGEIYEMIFDVWYCEVGSKEKVVQPEYKCKAVLWYVDRICGNLPRLKGKNIEFKSLSKTQGYDKLISGLDNNDRKRWYFGLKKAIPTYLHT